MAKTDLSKNGTWEKKRERVEHTLAKIEKVNGISRKNQPRYEVEVGKLDVDIKRVKSRGSKRNLEDTTNRLFTSGTHWKIALLLCILFASSYVLMTTHGPMGHESTGNGITGAAIGKTDYINTDATGETVPGGAITGAAIGIINPLKIKSNAFTNPSFENAIGSEWMYNETLSTWEGSRLTPTYFTPTHGTYTYLLGSDTSNGCGTVLSSSSSDYNQVKQTVDLTGINSFYFDTKYEDCYGSSSYFNISVLIDDGYPLWSRLSSDYVNNHTLLNTSGYSGVHNITFRLRSGFAGQIAQPAWYIDNISDGSESATLILNHNLTPTNPDSSTPITAHATYNNNATGNVSFYWTINGANIYNFTNQSVAANSYVTNTLMPGNFTQGGAVSLSITAQNSSESYTAPVLSISNVVYAPTTKITNPSFESTLINEWLYNETLSTWEGSRLTPTYFTPTHGTYTYLLGSDTSNGYGVILSAASTDYSQIKQTVDLTGVSAIYFDTKYEDYYGQSSYFNISVLIDDGYPLWSRLSIDYVNNHTLLDTSGYSGVHNITFRLRSGFDGGIAQPAWYFDNLSVIFFPLLASNQNLTPTSAYFNTTLLAQATYSGQSAGNVSFRWSVNGENRFNLTNLSVTTNSYVTSTLMPGNFTTGDTVSLLITGQNSTDTHTAEALTIYISDLPIAIANPSFEIPIGSEWMYNETLSAWVGGRLQPTFFTPTKGTYAYLLGSDTSNGNGVVLGAASTDYSQIKQTVNLTGVSAIYFDTKYEDYYGSSSYFNISVLIDDGYPLWSRLSIDYVNNHTLLNTSGYSGIHNITFRLRSGFAGAIAQPAWYIDNLSVTTISLPTHSTPLLNSTTYQNLSTGNITLYNVSTSDAEGDPVKNIYDWRLNDTGYSLLNWPMEGGSNSTFTRDYSRNALNGTVVGAIYNSTAGSDGKGAYQFDGTYKYLSLTDTTNSPLDITNQITVMAWIKPAASMGSYTRIIEKYYASSWFLGMSSAADGLTVWLNGGERVTTTANILATNQWYQVAFTYNKDAGGTDEVKIYVNGQLNASGDYSTAIGTDNHDLLVGAFESTGYNFNGNIDGINIYNRSLSAQEILALYQNQTNTIVSQELVTGDIWQGCITPNDGTGDGITKCSNNLTILAAPVGGNAAPSAPLLVAPSNLTTTVVRTPQFNWSTSNDTDGNQLTYNLIIDDSLTFNNPEINITGIGNLTSGNVSYNISTELDVDKTYFWRVRADDGTDFGPYSNVSNFTLSSYLAISLTQDTIGFGSVSIFTAANTTSGTPRPFRAENVGNIAANVTLSGTPYFSSISFPSSNYQFAIRVNETGAFNLTMSNTSWINMVNDSLLPHVVGLDWHDFKNDFLADILVRVPVGEVPGTKNSTVTFAISQQ